MYMAGSYRRPTDMQSDAWPMEPGRYKVISQPLWPYARIHLFHAKQVGVHPTDQVRKWRIQNTCGVMIPI